MTCAGFFQLSLIQELPPLSWLSSTKKLVICLPELVLTLAADWFGGITTCNHDALNLQLSIDIRAAMIIPAGYSELGHLRIVSRPRRTSLCLSDPIETYMFGSRVLRGDVMFMCDLCILDFLDIAGQPSIFLGFYLYFFIYCIIAKCFQPTWQSSLMMEHHQLTSRFCGIPRHEISHQPLAHLMRPTESAEPGWSAVARPQSIVRRSKAMVTKPHSSYYDYYYIRRALGVSFVFLFF